MSVTDRIPVGAWASESVEVTRDLTVAHFHAEMPEVYGTPMMIYLMEVAAAAAAHPYLPDEWVTVGVSVNVHHLAATPVGFTVTARAEVTEVAEERVSFRVEAFDEVERIGEGSHIRAPVEMARLVKGIEAKRRQRGPE